MEGVDGQALPPPVGPGIGGRDGAGGGTPPRQPGSGDAPRTGKSELWPTQRLIPFPRTGTPTAGAGDQGDALASASAPRVSAVSGTSAASTPTPARMPTSGFGADPAYTPAQRALISRYIAPQSETQAP